ncbi:MAG: hypothetical protein ACR2F2_01990 [Pyrinomonadaceae bacterium]
MSNSQENKGFKYGFKLGIIFSLLAQLITFYDFFTSVTTPTPDIITHRAWDIGFPFSMYSGWYLILSNGELEFNGFIGNIMFAMFFSVALGLIFQFKSELKDSIKSFAFIIGFVVGIFCFIFLNYYMQIAVITDSFADCIRIFGFPQKFVQTSNVNTIVIWRALIANTLIAVISSLVIGSIFKFVWSKISAKSN